MLTTTDSTQFIKCSIYKDIMYFFYVKRTSMLITGNYCGYCSISPTEINFRFLDSEEEKSIQNI